MKKAYLVLGSVMAAGMLFAQAPTVANQYSFAKTEKYPARGISVVENRIESNQNRAEYYSEDFDALTTLNGSEGWTAVLETGTANFKLTNTGHFNSPGNTFIIPDLASTTPTQWIVIDSDGDGTSYSNPERAALVSPVIDLQAASAPANVKLEFEQFFAEWGGNITDETEDSCFVGVSTDGGATWNEVEINANVGREGRPNPELFQVNIADWVAADPTNVQIRFRWAGAWNYGWQIDNVKIVDLENDEVAASVAYTRNIYDANNYQIQYAQVPLSQAHQVSLGCVAKNLGYNTANNIGVNYRVLDNVGTVVNSGSTTTENLTSLTAGPLGESDTIWFNTSWTPSAVGDYTIEMVVTHNAADENTSNDTITAPYFVTDFIYAREHGPITGGISNFASNNDGEFKMGVMFEIFADVDIYGINFVLDTALVGDLMFTELRKFNGTDWDYVNQTNDYTISESDFDNEVVAILPSSESATAGDLYLALYAHYGTTAGGLAPTIGASGTDFDGVLGYGVNVNSGAVTGLADPIVPKIRLNLDPALSINSVENEVKFSVFPNPANEELNVVISSAEAGKTSIVVRDLTGKIISNQQLGTVASIQTKINTEDLASGVYFVEVMNGSNKTVKKFTKK